MTFSVLHLSLVPPVQYVTVVVSAAADITADGKGQRRADNIQSAAALPYALYFKILFIHCIFHMKNKTIFLIYFLWKKFVWLKSKKSAQASAAVMSEQHCIVVQFNSNQDSQYYVANASI